MKQLLREARKRVARALPRYQLVGESTKLFTFGFMVICRFSAKSHPECLFHPAILSGSCDCGKMGKLGVLRPDWFGRRFEGRPCGTAAKQGSKRHWHEFWPNASRFFASLRSKIRRASVTLDIWVSGIAYHGHKS